MKFSYSPRMPVAPQVEVDLDLPRYSEQDLDNSAIYKKLAVDGEGNLLLYSIHEYYYYDKFEFAVERIGSAKTNRPIDLARNGEYYLGLDGSASTEEAWNTVVGKADGLLGWVRAA